MSDFTPETLTPESNMRVISCIKFRIFKGFEMRPALPSAPNPAQIMVLVYIYSILSGNKARRVYPKSCDTLY